MPPDEFEDLQEGLGQCLDRAQSLKAGTLTYIIRMAILEAEDLRESSLAGNKSSYKSGKS